jgi:cytochrome P450
MMKDPHLPNGWYTTGVERLRRLAYFHSNPSTQIPKANLQKMQEAVATVFRTERMEQYSQRCADIAQRTLDEWTKRAGRDGYIELAAAVQGLVMEINTRLLLGDAFKAAHGRAFAESFLALEKESAHLLARILPDLPFIPPVKRALEARRTLASLIEQELARLRQSKSSDDEGHLLHLLAQVKQEDGSWLPIEQCVDTVLQMFYYGQANTAGHLTWLVAHMSQRGHAQDLYAPSPFGPVFGNKDLLRLTSVPLLAARHTATASDASRGGLWGSPRSLPTASSRLSVSLSSAFRRFSS